MKLITRTVLVSMSVVSLSLLVGCGAQQPPQQTKSAIVYGESNLTLAAAAADVNVAMNSAAASGYRQAGTADASRSRDDLS